jgi:kinesin family protein 20
MIVHVNPYDTGFDENSHVMRFSAIAREIQTTASNKVGFPLLKRQISTQFSALRQAVSGPMKVKVVVPVLPRPTTTGPGTPQRAKIGMPNNRESEESFVMVEEEIEVVEEEDSDGEDDETDWMVEHLFDQLKEVKQRVSFLLPKALIGSCTNQRCVTPPLKLK